MPGIIPKFFTPIRTPEPIKMDPSKTVRKMSNNPIIVNEDQINALLDLPHCRTDHIDKRYKVIRFLLKVNGELVFGAEGTPMDHIPAHYQMADMNRDDAQCFSAGNAFFDENNKLCAINHKSGDFRPPFNSLQFALKAFLKSRILINSTIKIIELDSRGADVKIHTVNARDINSSAEESIFTLDKENPSQQPNMREELSQEEELQKAQAVIDRHIQQIRSLSTTFTNAANVEQRQMALHRQLNELLTSQQNEISNALTKLKINETTSPIAHAIEEKREEINAQAQERINELRQAEAQQRRDAEAQQRRDAEAHQRRDAEAHQRRDAEAHQRRDAEAQQRRDAEAHQRRDAEAQQRRDAEAQQRREEVPSHHLSNISMMVLGGFIAAAGIAAVAIAFAALNAATFGVAGLVVGVVGAAAALSGMGLFATGAYKNRQGAVDESWSFSGNLASQ